MGLSRSPGCLENTVNHVRPNPAPTTRRFVESRSTGGFTLIEALVLTIAIGILAVIAIPRISNPSHSVDAAVQSLAITLYAAQREAITHGHDIAIAFDQAQRRMLFLYDVNGNGVPDAGERVRLVSLDDSVVFGRGIAPARPMGGAAVTFGDTVGRLPAVIFHRDGRASTTGGVYLTSARAQATAAYASDSRAVEVARATGRAECWRYTGDGWTKDR